MKDSVRRRKTALAAIFVVLVGSASTALALQVPDKGGRFDALVVEDPTHGLDVATMPAGSLPSAARAGWDSFRAIHGADWSISLDRRSGAPLLVEGKGIPWPIDAGATVDSIAASLRPFIAANRALLMADDTELVLDRESSGPLLDEVWQISFDRVVAGVPVAGERYLFTIGHGNLISFGAPRWSRIDVSPVPEVGETEARGRVQAYMGLKGNDAVEDFERPKLQIIPLRAGGPAVPNTGYFDGTVGSGYGSALVWRFALRVDGDRGTWVALVDAHTGAIRSLTDDNKYVRVKGGIYPISDDQICPDGCEQTNYPMPFANVTIGAGSVASTSMGSFSCAPAGSTATTALSGTFFKVIDVCGAFSQSVTCSADLDLAQSTGIDCAVPAGSSAGNTHAARSSFYHLNRIAEHARSWLPGNSWLTTQVPDTVNINSTCNAYWDGFGVNFFKSGGGCNNTGEIASVFLHEWGHGLDQNDGGDFDNPSESYADVTSLMQTHLSCIGRGFFQSGHCGGYGDACLTCTGIREQDWDGHASHTPATPGGFAASHCPGGGGPCGREEHCEAHVSAEALWDLAVRDLPAMGLTQATSWQIADKLWYKSRLGSGGDAYNCSLPDSDGCTSTSWFSKIRTVDDDDGNLANGTPHAGAIFAAFSRHKIACGAVDDPSNQNSTICPALAAPTLTAAPGPGTALLTWTSVPNALSYRILRNDSGCQAASTRLTLISSNNLTDVGLANGFPLYYTVQAVSSNTACEGAVSNCQTTTPQPFAGTIKLDAGTYACSSATITVTVVDGNIGSPPSVTFVSATEPTGETIPITRIAPGSTTYRGTITTTAAAPATNGALSVKNGDVITATYVDGNDGGGGVNLPRVTTATASCVTPGVRPVPDGSFGNVMRASRADINASTINLAWDVATCSSTDHHLLYGDLATVASSTIGGAICNLGTSGANLWAGAPSGNLWFVIVGDDDAAIEGSWGTDGSGAQLGGGTASGLCGTSTRDNSGVCP
jgi:hypothetical protein